MGFGRVIWSIAARQRPSGSCESIAGAGPEGGLSLWVKGGKQGKPEGGIRWIVAARPQMKDEILEWDETQIRKGRENSS